MTHRLTLREIDPVTHDVNRLVFDRPEGYDFTPGQATLMRLDRDGWRDEERPFTFTSLPGEDRLEFVIKSYPSHDGVTTRIAALQPGDQVLIGEPWGAIEDRGPGCFIAGGAGITPFIAILRARAEREGDLGGSMLIFSNKAERDIILRQEWLAMPGLNTILTVTDEDTEALPKRRVDDDFLDEVVTDWAQPFYLCGPPPMVEDLTRTLEARGVTGGQLVTEEA
jgi:ferredoxin-NADP reductase